MSETKIRLTRTGMKHYPPEIENCSPEVRLRLYSLVDRLRNRNPPDINDIIFLAVYCEVPPEERRP